MKSPELKSSARTAVQKSTESNPFFSKTGAGAFGPGQDKKTPFFAGKNPVQAKLKVHPANDSYEKEADNAADRVVSQMHAPPQVQRKESDEEKGVQAMRLGSGISSIQTQRAFESPTSMEQNSASNGEQEMSLQTKSEGEAQEAGSGLESQLSGSKGKGAPLPEDIRSKMESGFRADFGGVRVHNDSNAAQMNKDLGARAFTHGSDIYFNQGEYKPSTTTGDHLLAHELTHTVQQGAAKTGRGAVQKKAGDNAAKSSKPLVSGPETVVNHKKDDGEIQTLQKQQSSIPNSGTGIGSGQNGGQDNSGSSPGDARKSGSLGIKSSVNSAGPVIQRQAQGAGAGSPTVDFNTVPATIEIPLINLPQAKGHTPNHEKVADLKRPKGPYNRAQAYTEVANESSSKEQRELWKTAVKGEVEKKVKTKAQDAESKKAFAKQTDANAPKIYYLESKKKPEQKLIGKEETITEAALIPNWTKAGKPDFFDVDHIRELQLGGKNFPTNMELLNFSINRTSGTAVRTEIEEQISNFISTENEKAKKNPGGDENKYPGLNAKFPKSSDDAKKDFNISFKKTEFKIKPNGSDDNYWTYDEITKGKQLDEFVPMSAAGMKKAAGSEEHKVLYSSPAGGAPMTEQDLISKNGQHIKFSNFNYGSDNATAATDSKVGSFNMEFELYGSKQAKRNFTVPIFKMDGVQFGGYLPGTGSKGGGGLVQLLVGLQMPGMSPIVIDQAGFVKGKGLVAKGRIISTLKVIEGLEVDFFVEGDDITISKTFSSGEIKVPKPFKINDANLTIFAGTRGFGVKGEVLFEIQNVGKGKIKGSASADGKFGISGRFDFDKKLFKGSEASIDVAYDNEAGWSIKGELELAKGSVKGVESGHISVSYANDILEASGTAKVKIKGIDEVTLRIKFGEGIAEIEGSVKISKLPGIKEGSGNLKIVKIGDEYDFSGSGTVIPDIPGVDTALSFEFHNDIFLVDAKVAYEKGRLKGNINVGITNRVIDAEGKPTGEALPDYKVYGNSDLELKVTDNIIVTAGVKLLENGEIEVKGGIKLPQKIEVVPKLFSVENKPLISVPPIHIPLFGIPLGVTTIGIEAVIKPKLEANVQIGPGSLANVQAEITYNPSQPDDMTITGGADFEFIAEAGITAGVDFGISASVAIASLTGGINLSAFIKASAQQPVFHTDIKYSPKTGFELEGDVKAIVQAVLGFSGKAYAEASIGVWPLDYTKRWEWPLFKKEIDTGLQIGFDFPFSYKNGNADVSFEKLKFVYPSMEDVTTKVKEQIVKPIADKF